MRDFFSLPPPTYLPTDGGGFVRRRGRGVLGFGSIGGLRGIRGLGSVLGRGRRVGGILGLRALVEVEVSTSGGSAVRGLGLGLVSGLGPVGGPGPVGGGPGVAVVDLVAPLVIVLGGSGGLLLQVGGGVLLGRGRGGGGGRGGRLGGLPADGLGGGLPVGGDGGVGAGLDLEGGVGGALHHHSLLAASHVDPEGGKRK